MPKLRLEKPECCLKFHFLSPLRPAPQPVRASLEVMHEQAAHTRFHPDSRRFAESSDSLFDETLSRAKEKFNKRVMDSFLFITH